MHSSYILLVLTYQQVSDRDPVSTMVDLSLSGNQLQVRSDLPMIPHSFPDRRHQYTPGLGPLYDDIWLLVLEHAHDCITNTPDPRQLRLVSRRFQQLVLSTPRLWHHIIRRVSYFNPAAIRSRIGFAAGVPLVLSLEFAHGDDLTQFAPIFRAHQSQWRSIETHGCDLSQLSPVFNACDLTSLDSLSFFPCPDLDHDDPSLGIGLSPFRFPHLRCLRLHLVQLRLVLSDTLERLYLDCLLPTDQTPLSLGQVFALRNLTHLLLTGIREDNALPNAATMPRLITLILFNVHANSVRPLLAAIDTPHLRTLAVVLSISSRLGPAQITSHLQPLDGYACLQLIHVHQPQPPQYPHAMARMLYTLGWAFPSVVFLQTNANWGLLATALNPTPADVPFSGQINLPIPIPFPRIHTLALRNASPRSLEALAQCLAFRRQTAYPITKCGVESHLLHTVRGRIPSETETVEWNRDLDADQQPLYPLF